MGATISYPERLTLNVYVTQLDSRSSVAIKALQIEAQVRLHDVPHTGIDSRAVYKSIVQVVSSINTDGPWKENAVPLSGQPSG